MADSITDKARETQFRNIETKTGKKMAELRKLIAASGLEKHGEIRDMLKERFDLGHGDANAAVHYALDSDGESAAKAAGTDSGAVLDQIYTGPKASLRPVHDLLMAEIGGFGAFEIAPKKGYVSLRRKKQFAMIGPASKGQVEVGLNMKDIAATERLVAQPPGGMCQYKVRLTTPAEVDPELIGWLRQAYTASG